MLQLLLQAKEQNMTNQELHEALVEGAKLVREAKLIQIERIAEAQQRGLHFDYGHATIFIYCRRELKYSKGDASRKIGAARVMQAAPEVKDNYLSGSLTLDVINVVSQGLKQKEKESKTKVTDREIKSIIRRIQNMELEEVYQAVSQELDIKLKKKENFRRQKDGSTRATVTFSKELTDDLQRLKEVMSHAMPGATETEIIAYAVRYVLKQKDPMQPKKSRQPRQKPTPQQRKPIPASIRRAVFQRDKCCQWQQNGHTCKSKFQLEPDHIHPVRDGGTNELDNLQLLCRVHNQLKYRNEQGFTH
jgi:hypothetical protein